MRGTRPFAALRTDMFWEQHVGLDRPYPPPFSQQKGERKRNGGRTAGLLVFETLRNWLRSDFFSLFLKTAQSSWETGLAMPKDDSSHI